MSLLGVLFCSTSRAEQSGGADSLRISLLTCAPGDAPYEFYGHTALRVQNSKTNQDLVFNYGIFDFDTPNFGWRFMTGQTDYTIGVSHFSSFANSYQRHGRCVVAQELNLTPAEEARLYAALVSDWSQPNWTYRYNIFYDNCTTRALTQIRKAVDGELRLPIIEDGRRTLRDILHEFSEEKSPWYTFGEDLILGSELDHPIDVWKQMFAPLYAETFLDRTSIMDTTGVSRPLVGEKEMVVQAIASDKGAFPVSPMVVSVVALLAVLMLSIWEIRKNKHARVFDNGLMFLQGLVGLLVAFLFFISEHPAVDTNWLILLLNPLPLIYLPVKIWRDKKGLKDYYFPVLALALALFALSVVFDTQKYPSAFYPLALILLIRVIMSFYFKSKKGLKSRRP